MNGPPELSGLDGGGQAAEVGGFSPPGGLTVGDLRARATRLDLVDVPGG
ncbi:hypothetical protein [Actinoplanes sp. G11-F43]